MYDFETKSNVRKDIETKVFECGGLKEYCPSVRNKRVGKEFGIWEIWEFGREDGALLRRRWH